MVNRKIKVGEQHWELPENLGEKVHFFPQINPSPSADAAGLANHGISKPIGYPRLRQALTPEDIVAIVTDDSTPYFLPLLIETLKEIHAAGVPYENTRLLLARETDPAKWIDSLPVEMEALQVELHIPGEKSRLEYLASSQSGEKIYLNRTLIEADQVVVIGTRRLDPLFGRGGAETEIFPLLTSQDSLTLLEKDWDGKAIFFDSNPLRARAVEAAWLLGAPYYIQAIEGPENSLVQVLAGTKEAIFQGDQLLDLYWTKEISHSVDLAICQISQCPKKTLFQEMARAVTFAKNIIKPGGKLVLFLHQPPDILPLLKFLESKMGKDKLVRGLDFLQGFAIRKWVEVASETRIHIYCSDPTFNANQLMALPIKNEKDFHALVAQSKSAVIIPEANKTFVRLEKKMESKL